MHKRSTDAADRLENIGNLKGKQGVPQDSHKHRGAFQQLGKLHDARRRSRFGGHKRGGGTRAQECTAPPVPDCTEPG